MTAPDARRAALASLVGLDGVGPARLRRLVADVSPVDAVDSLRGGAWPGGTPLGPGSLLRSWRDQLARSDPGSALRRYERAGLEVVIHGDIGYPSRLLADPDPPLILSVDGALDRLADRSVAIVGTRRCTEAGRATAHEIGRDLAAAGVTVVSGLAKGIDAAAHRGALEGGRAAPLAVVGTGLDVVYPTHNRALWRAVAAAGAVVSEAPLGAGPDRWRFPARNRIIAGLADVVVVVESPTRGGSLHTVDEADRRSVDVLAVPGPLRCRSSEGTNALLHEGRGVARDATDVLLALGFAPVRTGPADAGDRTRDRWSPEQEHLLDALEWRPATLDALVLRTGGDLLTTAKLLSSLCQAGAVTLRGGWYERVPR